MTSGRTSSWRTLGTTFKALDSHFIQGLPVDGGRDGHGSNRRRLSGDDWND